MDTGTIVTIALAAASGAAWLAYQHPSSFRRLGLALTLLGVVVGAWLTGTRNGIEISLRQVTAAKLSAVETAKLKMELLDKDTSVLLVSDWILGVMVVVVFLMSFPLWLRKDED